MSKDTQLVVGLDVSDRFSSYCVLDRASGAVLEHGKVMTRPESLQTAFGSAARSRFILETGTHASWIARFLRAAGHEVVVADARRLRFIYMSDRKDDHTDAEMLARVGRMDAELLHPVRVRAPETEDALAVLRARDAAVRMRTALINAVRGQVKHVAGRLPRTSAECFPAKVKAHLPERVRAALEPLLELVAASSAQIAGYDRQIEALCRARPETARLRQVKGVGPVTALAYVLVIEDPARFKKSREVGPYLGLIPRRDQSGESDPQMRITRAGDVLLRRLLVGSAQYILGPFGPDTDLRRWGLAHCERSGGHAKKRAVVAVARRLAVLLHRLWVSGEEYRPLREAPAAA